MNQQKNKTLEIKIWTEPDLQFHSRKLIIKNDIYLIAVHHLQLQKNILSHNQECKQL
jgi:hypothetical protein